jgi:glycosyltransferase involved in cell wall biosynthesis
VLSSSYQNYELVIVDDCSNDQTLAIARKYERKDSRVKVFFNDRNLGDYPNRNQAASFARGKYIKYLDSDDIMYAHCLEVMVSSMEKFPEAGFGLSSKGDNQRPYPVCLTPAETYREHFLGYGHFDRAPGSSIIKLEAFRNVGCFSNQRHVGDTDMWYKLSLSYNMVKFPPDLYWARTHIGQEANIESQNEEFKKVRKDLQIHYLNHENCPLKKDEIVRFMKQKKRFYMRHLFDNLIR